MTIYANPEKYALKILYECDAAESYSFDKIVLWKDERTGSVLMGKDSGWSCPSPFEDTGVKDLETATPEGINEWFDEPDYNPRRNNVGPEERQKALSILEMNLLTEKDLKNAKPLPSPDDVRKRFLGE